MKKKINVPIIMYHSIGIPNKTSVFRHLTCYYKLFESQLKWMRKKSFHTITLQDLYNYMKEGMTLPKNPIVLTFDDGYLDNWVFAYPLLKKYEYTGTIYVSPEFVYPENICRKTLNDIKNNEEEINKLETTGYLSWYEMMEMVKEKVIDIQSHCMTHTLYFKSNKIIDFRHPNDSYIWMTWNNNPEKKPYLQIDNNQLINYGEPVYEHENALVTQRFFPDNNLSKYLIEYVAEQDIQKFFMNNNWKNELFKIVEIYKKENKLDEKIETEEDYNKRIKYELEKSKEIIKQKLKIDVQFLCWPIGGTNQQALKIASNVGYISSTTARDINIEKKNKMKNTHGENPSRINRIGPILYWNGKVGMKSKIKYRNGFLFVLLLYDFQGKKVIRIANKCITFIYNNPWISLSDI